MFWSFLNLHPYIKNYLLNFFIWIFTVGSYEFEDLPLEGFPFLWCVFFDSFNPQNYLMYRFLINDLFFHIFSIFWKGNNFSSDFLHHPRIGRVVKIWKIGTDTVLIRLFWMNFVFGAELFGILRSSFEQVRIADYSKVTDVLDKPG